MPQFFIALGLGSVGWLLSAKRKTFDKPGTDGTLPKHFPVVVRPSKIQLTLITILS